MNWLRHLFPPSAHRLFPPASLQRIAAAIAAGESRHDGEVMFAVEAGLPLAALWRGATARMAAEAAFARLHTWDTARNNGVLVYLLLAEHHIEIVADRGLSMVAPEQWREVCAHIEQGMRQGDAEAAVVAGIEAASDLLARHFPALAGGGGGNELPDLPRIL
ncbi:MAG: TPM domain-containing protein [Pseudoxanthomonas sp.]